MSEAVRGSPGSEAIAWHAVPADQVVGRLNTELRRVLALDDTQKRLAGLGMVATPGSPEEFDAYIKAEIAKWGKVIRDADIKAAE